MDRVLLWLADRRSGVRIALAVLAALLVYVLGRAVAVAPLEDRADRLRAEAGSVESRLEAERRRLEGFEPPPEELLADLDSLRGELHRAAGAFPGGLRSGQLTVFSDMAEEAGATAPLFNVRSPTSAGDSLGGLRILTVEGDLRGDTRSVARFLERLGEAPMPVVVDSLGLYRQVPDNAAVLKLRVLAPAGEG